MNSNTVILHACITFTYRWYFESARIFFSLDSLTFKVFAKMWFFGHLLLAAFVCWYFTFDAAMFFSLFHLIACRLMIYTPLTLHGLFSSISYLWGLFYCIFETSTQLTMISYLCCWFFSSLFLSFLCFIFFRWLYDPSLKILLHAGIQ